MGRIRHAWKRAQYAAVGAAIGAGIGGLFSRSAASTGGATGALVGAAFAEFQSRRGDGSSADEPSDEGESEGLIPVGIGKRLPKRG